MGRLEPQGTPSGIYASTKHIVVLYIYINVYMHCHKCGRGRIKGTSFEVVMENEELVEISFTRKWDSSLQDHIAPINVDKRYLIYIRMEINKCVIVIYIL